MGVMLRTQEIEEHIARLNLPGLPPDKAVIPNYNGYSIRAIPHFVRSLFGDPVEGARALIDAMDPPLKGPVEKVILLIIDGFGFHHLLDLLQRFPDLYLHRLIERGRCIPLTSVFPATTATALPTLCTGLTPQEHGMVGYRLYLKEISAITNMIRLTTERSAEAGSAVEAGIDVQRFLGTPTLYAQLHQLGVDTHVVLSRHIASSGLSSLLYDGNARLHPVVNLSDMLVVARRILQRTSGRAFVSLYWGGTDAIAHIHGPWTEEFAAELHTVDTAIARELEGQVGQALFIITSDHGFVPMEASDYRLIKDEPELSRNLVLPPVGEPRATYLYVREGKKRAMAEMIRERFGDELICLDAGSALEAGLFGQGPVKAEVADRIGDLLVISVGKTALFHPHKDAAMLKGVHGGLTAREMLVPLIVSRLQEKEE